MSRIFADKNFSLDNLQHQILEGLLLGDGSITRRHNKSPRYSHGTSKKETLITILNLVKFTGNMYTYKYTYKNGEISEINVLTTHGYPQLKVYAKRWYPNGIKIVPRDLILTPTVCYWWYIGDGCLSQKIQYGKKCTHVLTLSTNGFSDDDRNILIDLMVKHINIDYVGIEKCGRLCLYSTDIPKFLSYIGKCANTEYEYKWNYITPSHYRKRKNLFKDKVF